MFIGKQLQVPYVVEIARLSYEFSLKNGCTVKICGADLIQFMNRYVPEIDMAPYAEFATRYLKYQQTIDLLYFMRYKLSPITEPYLYDSLFELSIDVDSDSSDRPRFEEMKAEKMDAFLEAAYGAYATVINQEKAELRPIQPFTRHSPTQWVFADGVMTQSDDESVITLTKSSIAMLADHFRSDFMVNGQENLQSFDNGKITEHKYISLDYFIENFEKDLAKFKEGGLTFEGFVDLMVGYKFCDKYD